MQFTTPREFDPADHVAALGAGQGLLAARVEQIYEHLVVFEAVDAQAQSLPADHVHRAEIETGFAALVHIHEVDPARARLVGMTPLWVAGIHDLLAPVAQYLPRVHMPERPVVHPRGREIVERAGCVQLVLRVAVHIRMQQTDREAVTGDALKPAGQVSPLIARRVAHPVDRPTLRVFRVDRYRLDFRAEAYATGGERNSRLPTVQRVVVAVADKRSDAVFC